MALDHGATMGRIENYVRNMSSGDEVADEDDTTGSSALAKQVPDFASWLIPIQPSEPDNPDENSNNLRSVRFGNCDRATLTVKDCHWTNVLVAHCKFTEVTFRNVKLANVALTHLDFENVTIIDLDQFCRFWRNLSVQNALLS